MTTKKFIRLTGTITPTDVERFWAKIIKSADPDGCWTWVGNRLPRSGYGRMFLQNHGKSPRLAHRIAHELLIGPIPDGLEVDHLCRIRHCVNPRHLQAVTPKVNNLRGSSIPAQNFLKTTCRRGHPLTGDNLYIDPTKGSRSCRACGRMNDVAYRRRRGAQALADRDPPRSVRLSIDPAGAASLAALAHDSGFSSVGAFVRHLVDVAIASFNTQKGTT